MSLYVSVNLAISDLLMANLMWIHLQLGITHEFPFGNAVCKIFPFFQSKHLPNCVILIYQEHFNTATVEKITLPKLHIEDKKSAVLHLFTDLFCKEIFLTHQNMCNSHCCGLILYFKHFSLFEVSNTMFLCCSFSIDSRSMFCFLQ